MEHNGFTGRSSAVRSGVLRRFTVVFDLENPV
jgi:hypothetical protein